MFGLAPAMTRIISLLDLLQAYLNFQKRKMTANGLYKKKVCKDVKLQMLCGYEIFSSIIPVASIAHVCLCMYFHFL